MQRWQCLWCVRWRRKEKAGALSAENFVPADTVAVSDMIEGLTARSAVVTEMTTGRVLFEKKRAAGAV